MELGRLRHRRAGHAGELGIEAEIILERDRGERLVLVLDGDVLFRLERLVKALGIAAALHHPAGELVDDDHLVIAHDVVRVAREEFVRAERLVGVMRQRDVVNVIERAGLHQARFEQQRLDALDARVRQRHGALLLVLLVILGLKIGDELVDLAIKLGRILGGAGNDERRARLVDQDRIDLVDNRVVERALHHLLEPELHVVAEIVEAELVVGAVGHVGRIGLAPLVVVEAVDDAADLEAEEAVDLPHPLAVALGKIVVHRDDMDALAGQRVEIDRKGRDQGLALAGLHLGDHAAVEDDAAHELDVEMALAERALGRLAHGGESGNQQIVDVFAVLVAFLQRFGAAAEIVVREGGQLGLELVDLVDQRAQALDVTIVRGTKQSPG